MLRNVKQFTARPRKTDSSRYRGEICDFYLSELKLEFIKI